MGKHTRIRTIDPFCTGPRKEKYLREIKRLEAKQNVAPEDPDTQATPRSFKEMMERIDEMNKPIEQKRKEKKEKKKASIARMKSIYEAEDKIAESSKHGDESNKKFLMRVAKTSNSKIRDQKMKILKGDEIHPKDKKKPNENAKRKFEILKKTAEYKKVEKDLDKLEKDYFTDNVAFGEVVLRPPQLSSKPRGSKESDQKGGRRQLLLSSLMTQSNRSTSRDQLSNRKFKKRKIMTLHEQKVFDEKQHAAVDAYKKVKKQRMSTWKEQNR